MLIRPRTNSLRLESGGELAVENFKGLCVLPLWVVSIAFYGVIISTSAHGQDQTQVLAPTIEPQVPAAAEATSLQEIVVTAQKREQRLQDVPISVTAITSDALSRANVFGVTDLPKLAPGLNIDAGVGVALPFLRGVGNPSNVLGNESSVAFYVDGVYVSRLQPSFLDFLDVERVEVLNGPQGTLFGRNASAGAINIVTKIPSFEPEVNAEIGYANYDTTTARFYASTGLTDNLALSVTGLFRDQREGWGNSVSTGAENGGLDNHKAFRADLRFTPSSSTEIQLSADYLHSDTDVGMPNTIFRGFTQGGTDPVRQLLPLSFYDTRSTIRPTVTDEVWGSTLRIKQGFNSFDITSLTGYSGARGDARQDVLPEPEPYETAVLNYITRQLSEELQIASHPGSYANWLGGLYYLDSYAAYDPTSLAGSFIGPGNDLLIYGTQDTKSYAAFGQVTVPIFEDTNLTVGGRYTYDVLHASGATDLDLGETSNVLAPEITPTATFKKPTYKISLDHHFLPELMVYTSYGRGFKDGVFNLLGISPTPVNPEVIDTEELGFKDELFDRRIRFNGTFFYSKIHDLQVQIFENNLTELANAKSAVSKGFEFQLDSNITSQLTGRLSGQFLDAYYTSYNNAPFTSTNPDPPYGNLPFVGIDASGYRLPRAPSVSLSAGATYTIATSLGKTEFSLDYAYKSSYFFDPGNSLRQKPVGLLDANVRLYPTKHFSIGAWGKNLTGEQYYIFANESAGTVGTPAAPAAPRTFGITFYYNR